MIFTTERVDFLGPAGGSQNRSKGGPAKGWYESIGFMLSARKERQGRTVDCRSRVQGRIVERTVNYGVAQEGRRFRKGADNQTATARHSTGYVTIEFAGFKRISTRIMKLEWVECQAKCLRGGWTGV